LNRVELYQAIQQIRAIEGVEFIPKKLLPYRPANAPACWGNCYPITEALYHLWGKKHGYEPAYVYYKLRKKGLPVLTVTHWFLIHKYGATMDATAAQFQPAITGLQAPGGDRTKTCQTAPDYHKAVRCGFLTKKPSKRARKFMRGVKKAMAATA
jgi:hypothetical protein